MTRLITRGIASSVAAAAILAVSVVPASASVTRTITVNGLARGTVTWNPTGETITVKDTRADGHGVWAQLNTSSFNYVGCDNRKGSGTSVTCDYSLAEGTSVRINYGWFGKSGIAGTITSTA